MYWMAGYIISLQYQYVHNHVTTIAICMPVAIFGWD